MKPILLAPVLLASLAAADDAPPPPTLAKLTAMQARFAPVPIGADLKGLPENERACVRKLVEASKIVDTLFLRQAWGGNETLLLDLAQDRTPLGRARLRYFVVNKGPWSRLDHHQAFLPGLPPRPPSGSFYPEDATKEEVDAWMKALPEGERTDASGFFTTVRRGPDRKLRAVPYSVEYQPELSRMASLLREAAQLTAQPTLKSFLTQRADALLTNDYYASDVAWMELDASIEPTLGPYETYEDEWFGFKAAFESFVTVRDDAETAKLSKFSAQLQGLEDVLPIDPRYRNPKLGALAPIRVVNVVFSAGDGNRGVQTAAYNLPNDERVVSEKGSKRVMLKNNQQAKFDKVLVPIAATALPPADRANVSFDAFFTHILMHELMHGLGPQTITVNGRSTTVRQELKESYGVLEEAKADISGLWALQKLVDKGALAKELERTMYTTFLASTFRSIRFGLNEAHGRGVALQLNHLLDAGAFTVRPDGTFTVDRTKIRGAVEGLTREIMTLQAEGDAAKAKDLLARLAVIRPEVQKVLDRLSAVPVDIEPRFTILGAAAPGATAAPSR